MNKCEVVDMFYKQDRVCYSKDFELFERVYQELKDELDLIREEDGDTVIVKHRKTKAELIKEIFGNE